MGIFAILTAPENTALETAISLSYPHDSLKIRSGQWLVAAPSTAKEVSDKLQITDGQNGAAVVVNVASYFGRAEPTVWEWIRTKWASQNVTHAS